MTRIENALVSFNPWWEKGFSSGYLDRDIYSEIKRYMDLPMMIALSGLRRVGKSTLMFKIAEDYISKGTNSHRIMYFSFDNFKDAEPMDIIKEYEKLNGIDIREGKYLLLFDEVQKLADWQDKIKVVYDLYKGRVKIILSGSESLFMRKKAKESLAGRIFMFKVNQLSFSEFLRFKGMEKITKYPRLYQKERLRLFDEYIHTQGFPELVQINDKEIVRKYIREGIIDKVIYKDIPQLFKVENPEALESLLNILMEEPGQLLELSALASELKITRQTLSNYVSYLEESQLLRKLYNYSRSSRKTERKLKKYYPSIISVDLAFAADRYSKSKAFEWLVVNQMSAEFFWRDAYKNEVDMVFGKKEPRPVEIKYGKIATDGLVAFMRRFNVQEGEIISYEKYDTLRMGDKVIRVTPACAVLSNPREMVRAEANK